jgi:general secretion pathway protein A
MYTQFFGLEKKPFVLSPDPEFFYSSKGHDLAFTHLEYGLMHNVGFIALTGDVGTGKTTLLKYLLNRVGPSLNIGMIFNTQVDPHSFLEMLVKEFELNPASNRKSDLYSSLYEHFLKEYSRKNRCVIFVDEAQNLSLRGFEELRMLSNLDAGNDPLVQIVLVGQPQLRNRLAHESLAQLTQRISVHYHLSPMGSDEVIRYIEHRLKAAGYARPGPLFENDAVECIADVSRGIPRVINSICDASLTYAYADRLERVARQTVEKVISDNEMLFSTHKSGQNDYLKDSVNGGGTPSIDGLPPGAGFSAPGFSDFGGAFSNILARLSSLEEKMADSNIWESERAVKLLYELLAKEREQTRQYSLKLAKLSNSYKRVLKELQETRLQQQTAIEGTQNGRKRQKRWRIFSREEK